MSTVQNNSRSTQQENHNLKIVTGSRLLDLLSSETPSWKEHRDQLTSSETPSERGERDQVKNSETSSWREERDQAKNSETSSWRGEGDQVKNSETSSWRGERNQVKNSDTPSWRERDQVKNSETPSWRGLREVKSSETPSSERQKDEVKCSETPTWRGQRGRSKSSETPISRGEKDKMKSSETANWRGQRDRVKSSETPSWTGQSHKVKNQETASSRGQRDQAKSSETPSLRAKTGKVKSLETASSRGQRDQVTSSETPSWIVQRDEAKSSGPRTKLENLMNKSSNKFCADCDSPNPKWVSLNIGVFICIKCSGIHRSLGVHISKVISVNLDDWTDEQVDALADMGGNAAANEKYEAFLPDYIRKPKPDSSIEDRADFIRSKYEKLEFSTYDEDKHVCQFLPSHERSSSSSPQVCLLPEDRRQNEKHPTRQKIGNAFRNSWGRKDSESKQAKKNSALLQASMVEFVGLVKVNVVKGINLVIRDVRSSDPYVILALGHQSVKTRVIKSNLNPVWNESLLLSIPDNVPPLKVVVYDKDRFSNDDFMGEAEIDIQPLLTAARAYERSTLNESTQLGTWKATKENTLVEDGIINLVDGKVKQEINLRLQKVERGVLQIELECLPLTQ